MYTSLLVGNTGKEMFGGPCSEGLLTWGGLEHNVMMGSGLVELDGGDGSELELRFLQVLYEQCSQQDVHFVRPGRTLRTGRGR
jgi:hypothetical protein